MIKDCVNVPGCLALPYRLFISCYHTRMLSFLFNRGPAALPQIRWKDIFPISVYTDVQGEPKNTPNTKIMISRNGVNVFFVHHSSKQLRRDFWLCIRSVSTCVITYCEQNISKSMQHFFTKPQHKQPSSVLGDLNTFRLRWLSNNHFPNFVRIFHPNPSNTLSIR